MAIFKPGCFVDSILEISPKILKKNHIKSVFIDIDDTLTPHGSQVVERDVYDWINLMISNNIKLILVSNNFKRRVQKFAQKISLPFIYLSLKPLPIGFFLALRKAKIKKSEAVVVGDQIFTDILGANLFGMKSVLVEPKSKSRTLSLKLKRFIEKPIRNRLKKTYFCHSEELE